MNALEIIIELKKLNVKLLIQDGNLKLSAARGVLTNSWLELIKQHKTEIIDILSKAEKDIEGVVIQNVEKKDFYMMSSTQSRLYSLQMFDVNSKAYNIPRVIPLGTDVNVDRIKAVFHQLIERHECLRTSFHLLGEGAFQRIHESVEFDISIHRIDHEQLDNFIHSFGIAFDLSKAPLLRAVIIITDRGEHFLLLDIHHIISDATSNSILEKDFVRLYAGEDIPPLRLQFKDYSEWQKTSRRKEKRLKQENYWLSKFRDDIPVLNLPTDFPRPIIKSSEGAVVDFVLTLDESTGIKNYAKSTGQTLYMALLSAFSILLSKISGQQKLIIGTPIAGRNHVDLEGIVGMLVNTLAIVVEVDGSTLLRDFAKNVKEDVVSSFEYQDYPFEDLVDRLSIEHSASHNPLFDVMFNMLNHAEKDGSSFNMDEDEYIHRPANSKFDISLVASTRGGHILLSFEYCTKLFRAETIERFIGCFRQVVRHLHGRLNDSLSDIVLISEEEKREILYSFNNIETSYPKDKTIVDLFEDQVQNTPTNIAVVYEGVELQYDQLNRRANQLAEILIERGVRHNAIVGVEQASSSQYIIFILAVLKAGGAFLPIDPSLPALRKEYIANDSGIQYVILNSSSSAVIYSNIEVVNYEGLNLTLYNEENPCCDINGSDLAYVIYTSGSTGRSKGVLLEHKGIVSENHLWDDYLNINASDKCLQFASISFDASIWEIFMSLLNGASLYIPTKEIKESTLLFEKYLIDNRITVVSLTPVYANLLNESSTKFIRLLVTGGSETNGKLINRFKNIRYINSYGPTETSVCATCWDTSEYEKINKVVIGRPIRNIKTYVMNTQMQLQGIGLSGELCIAGVGVARGYMNQPELTNQQFVELPNFNDGILYRTGDSVRWLSDGNLEFLGRIDNQVKIRGFRIEPEEIKCILMEHKYVQECAVVVIEEAGEKKLCAYIVLDKSLAIEEIKSYLVGLIPDYMVPSYFSVINELPVNRNGKIDYKLLPLPDKSNVYTYVAPSNDIEEQLTSIWSDILHISKGELSVTANFFSLGGHSLKAITLSARIHSEFNVEIGLKEIFSSPTIKGLASMIEVILLDEGNDRIDENVKREKLII
ncbi:MAG: amino acid adenylation domain-containing protein [Marinifilaceae bacterium]